MVYEIMLANGDTTFVKQIQDVFDVEVDNGVYILRDEDFSILFSAPCDSVLYINRISLGQVSKIELNKIQTVTTLAAIMMYYVEAGQPIPLTAEELEWIEQQIKKLAAEMGTEAYEEAVSVNMDVLTRKLFQDLIALTDSNLNQPHRRLDF